VLEGIHVREVLPEPCRGNPLGDLRHRHQFLSPLERRPISHDQTHRRDDMASAGMAVHLPRYQQPLIGVKVKHASTYLQIGLRQLNRHLLHHRVADRVGMAQTLPLDNFERLVGEGIAR
jgi:hypothetical protein